MGQLIHRSILPEQELGICRRFGEIRKNSGLSQAAFAQEVGIPLGSVSNYEYGKTALRADIALRACYIFLANERWLATGEGDWQPCVDLYQTRILVQLKRGELYSSAYNRVLSKEHDQLELLPNDQLIMRLLKSDLNAPARLGRIFSYTQSLFGLLFPLLKIQAHQKKSLLDEKGCSDEKTDRLLQIEETDFLHTFYAAGIRAALDFFANNGLEAKPIIPVMRDVEKSRLKQKVARTGEKQRKK